MALDKELIHEIPNIIRIYNDKTVERLMGSPHVPPSLEHQIPSKDVVISPHVSARLHLPKLTPKSSKKLPILVYIHGGGFLLGSAFTLWENNYINTIISHINALVIAVEYRLAPEHLLPAAYDDCWEALQWVTSHSTTKEGILENQEPWLVQYGDFARLYIGGDSAGANIVHNLSLKAGRERLDGDVKILGGFLGCPYFLSSTNRPSSDESYLYKCWMLAHPNAPGGVDNPMISPFVGEFDAGLGFQKLLVVVAEKDELREIGIKYFEAVKENEWDGEVALLDIEGEDHCFYIRDSTTEKAKILMEKLASFIV